MCRPTRTFDYVLTQVRKTRKARYRWSHAYHCWMLQWPRLAPPQLWPSILMPELPRVDDRGLLINPYNLGGGLQNRHVIERNRERVRRHFRGEPV